VAIFDDYGHHPVEIAAVLRAARAAASGKVIAVVQPHRYSRLQSLFESFAGCFNDADAVIVADVYPAGETPIAGVDKQALAAAINAHGHRHAVVLPSPTSSPASCAGSPGRATMSSASAPAASPSGPTRCQSSWRAGGCGMMQKAALALRHVAFEDVGVWAATLDAEGYDLAYVDVGLRRLPLDRIQACDLLIVLGAPIGVYETEAYPFLIEEIAAIERRLAARRPTLGVCLGAQLMAAALGARVAPGPGKEIGYAPVELVPAAKASPLAAIEGLNVLHWHGDAFDLPSGAERLAATTLCPNQAFRLGDWALALQFHSRRTLTRSNPG